MQKNGSSNQLGHNDLCSHAISNVDIDDISSTLNFFFNSSSREDLFTNFSFHHSPGARILKSVELNPKHMCETHIVALTIKSHKESLCSTFLFLPLVIIATPSPDIVTIESFLCTPALFRCCKRTLGGEKCHKYYLYVHINASKRRRIHRETREKSDRKDSLFALLCAFRGFLLRNALIKVSSFLS